MPLGVGTQGVGKTAHLAILVVVMMMLAAVVIFMWTRQHKFMRHAGAGLLLLLSGLTMANIKHLRLRNWGIVVGLAGVLLFVSHFWSPTSAHTSKSDRALLANIVISAVVGLSVSNLLTSSPSSSGLDRSPHSPVIARADISNKVTAYKDRSIVQFVDILTSLRALRDERNDFAREVIGTDGAALVRDLAYMHTFLKYSRTLFRASSKKVLQHLFPHLSRPRDVSAFWNDILTLNVNLLEHFHADPNVSSRANVSLRGYGDLWMLLSGAQIDLELSDRSTFFRVTSSDTDVLLQVMDTKYVRTIAGDLHRTRLLTRENYPRAITILLNYARRFPEYTYEQGHLSMMPYMLSELDEEQVFWVYSNMGFTNVTAAPLSLPPPEIVDLQVTHLSEVPAILVHDVYPIQFVQGQIWPHASGKIILTLRLSSARMFWLAYACMIQDIAHNRYPTDDALVHFLSNNRQPFEPHFNRPHNRAHLLRQLTLRANDSLELFTLIEDTDALRLDFHMSSEGADAADATTESESDAIASASSIEIANPTDPEAASSDIHLWLASPNAAMPDFDGLEAFPHSKAAATLTRWAQSVRKRAPSSAPDEWIPAWLHAQPRVHLDGAQVHTIASLSKTSAVAAMLVDAIRKHESRRRTS